MFNIHLPFKPSGDQPKAIEQISSAFQQGEKFQALLGVTGSGKTFTMANIIQKIGKKTLILAPNKTLAAQLYAEFKEFFPENSVEYFVSFYDYYRPEAYVPGKDVYIEKDSAINDEIDKLRHSATMSLLTKDDVIVVSSVSCIYGIGEPEEYFKNRVNLSVFQEMDRDSFMKKLVEIQYLRSDVEFNRGTFRVRGDIVDVFPAWEDARAIRVEFFDEEIDSIKIIDSLTNKFLTNIKQIDIFPKSHYVVGEEKRKKAIETIKVELRQRLIELKKENKLVEAQRLEQRTLLDLELLEETGFCSGIENYSRHFSGAKEGEPPSTLIDYFNKNFLIILDESHIMVPQVGAMYKGDRSRKQNLVDYGFRLPSALDNRPLTFSEFESKLDTVLYVSATPSDFELEKTKGHFVEQVIRPTGLLEPIVEVKPSENQIDDFLIEAKKVIKKGSKVLVTTLTKKLAEELTNYFTGVGLRIKYLHSDVDALERMEIIRGLRMGEFDALVGINLLREGLDIPEVSLVGILDADKEGFLRSTRSLVQTIGRAARNSEGKVILYGNKITKSMQEALDVTNKRREVQIEYNKQNNIKPKTVSKKISGGVIDVLKKKTKAEKKEKKVQELTAESIDMKIFELKKEMKQVIKDLNFERAAILRDEIKNLTEIRLVV